VILLQVVVSGLLMGAVYALFSSGLTLIWGMMNVVNFAHGDFVMLAMYVAFFAYTLFHLGPAIFIPAAAALLFVLGVVVYMALVRHIARGPMLAQILGTFGLALVLRYAAFWAFSANFVSLPDTLVGGTFDLGGLRIEASRLLGGVLALVITIGLHLVLTRTMLGSRLLAVAEDRSAAMLMGIRPDRMQALAWGVGAAAAGVAGALIALFFYISPTVGESLTLIAFVVVCLGGFGSVPGALIAGLTIGVIQALSAYLLGAVYQDAVVYALFLLVLWVRPQGLMGSAA
jgi:branched-chain amino acid transport system permease protein